MITENYSFLPILISEPVYLIERPAKGTSATQEIQEKRKTTTPPVANVPPAASASLGTEKKIVREVVIVMSDADTAKKPFLEKILLAVNINLAEVAVFTSVASIPADIHYNKAICFGEKISGVSYYVPSPIQNRTILLADTLAEIESDVNKKKLLWGCLQKMFLKS
jgi:hypothetical protein